MYIAALFFFLIQELDGLPVRKLFDIHDLPKQDYLALAFPHLTCPSCSTPTSKLPSLHTSTSDISFPNNPTPNAAVPQHSHVWYTLSPALLRLVNTFPQPSYVCSLFPTLPTSDIPFSPTFSRLFPFPHPSHVCSLFPTLPTSDIPFSPTFSHLFPFPHPSHV